jgi:hypothetical protein
MPSSINSNLPLGSTVRVTRRNVVASGTLVPGVRAMLLVPLQVPSHWKPDRHPKDPATRAPTAIIWRMAAITMEVYTSMGLTSDEYALILKLLDREPTHTELGMFAVMWSEHCGYKFSRPILAAFKKYKEAIEGSGLENAGVVEIGDGWGVTMKVESHNHPSAVEPYQGAATGVGGIIRDILTMGARPIALLNYRIVEFTPFRTNRGWKGSS